MRDDAIQKLVQTLDTEVAPPEGLRERLITRIIMKESSESPVLSSIERFLYEKPLRAAGAIAIAISSLLWAVMGGNFAKLVTSLIG